MLHAVDAGDESKMSTGMQVKARWAPEPQGSILDLAVLRAGMPERATRDATHRHVR